MGAVCGGGQWKKTKRDLALDRDFKKTQHGVNYLKQRKCLLTNN